jgi:threonine dehydratase
MTEPRAPTRDEIEAARERIAGHVRVTPVIQLEAGTLGLDHPLTLKLELLQHTGSFKPRGAFSKMLASEVPAAGVVAASGGNFGLAVAYAARSLGHPAEIFVPSTSPAVKAERIRREGATVRVVEGQYDDAAAAERERATAGDVLPMHPFDQPEVVAGQGTIGIELDAQAPDADTVLVSVGGGGLIGGIAAWVGGTRRVVAVEPEGSRCLAAALEAAAPVEVSVDSIAADSLGARRVGDIAFASARANVERAVLVSDDAIRDAQRAVWRELRLVAEPGGAAALAALRCGAYRPERGERVVVVMCGANCDPADVVEAAPAPGTKSPEA